MTDIEQTVFVASSEAQGDTMPKLTKSAISLYLRSGCKRQLVLNLYNDEDRRRHGMPGAIRSRADASLTALQEAGYEWQSQKAKELRSVCGESNVVYEEEPGSDRPARVELSEVIESLQPGQFVIEPSFNAAGNTFSNALELNQLRDNYGESIDLASAAPDIIQVLPPVGTWDQGAGDLSTTPNPNTQEIKSDGKLEQLDREDPRLRLRVIDVKMSSEPGPHYFAEVVLYSIALAAWIYDRGLNDRFAVVAAPGVWAASYRSDEIKNLRQLHSERRTIPDPEEVANALDKEIEVAQYEVFAARLKRLCSNELPLATARQWDQLDWHVDYNCAHCEYLGHPDDTGSNNRQSGRLHCWNMAQENDSLCRIAGLTKASASLLRGSHPTVADLAGAPPDDTVFEQSSGLRAKRHIYSARARALSADEAYSIPEAGTPPTMPQWPDLHIYLFLDYDLSTAITGAFGLRTCLRSF